MYIKHVKTYNYKILIKIILQSCEILIEMHKISNKTDENNNNITVNDISDSLITSLNSEFFTNASLGLYFISRK